MNTYKEEPKTEKVSETNELKNIRYKTMYSSSSMTDVSDLTNLDTFLENEKTTNQTEPWAKLDKTMKFKKILEFIEKYAVEKDLTPKEKIELTIFLKDAIDKKKIQKVKDIVYDKVNNVIKDIPCLVYLKNDTRAFTLKSSTKISNTLKCVPKKKKEIATISS
jgi:hypothetical protein